MGHTTARKALFSQIFCCIWQLNAYITLKTHFYSSFTTKKWEPAFEYFRQNLGFPDFNAYFSLFLPFSMYVYRLSKKLNFHPLDSKAGSNFFCGKTRIKISLKTCVKPSSTVQRNEVKVFNPTLKQILSLNFKQKIIRIMY